jgi:hypothetical protein
MSFVNDTFTEAGTTAIASHTSDSGHTWATGRTSDGGVKDNIQSSRVCGTGSGDSNGWYSSAVPASADYDVQADCFVESSGKTICGIAARMSTSANTEYFVNYNAGTWRLYSVSSGTESSIGTYLGDAPTTTKTCVLRVTGTTIEVLIDGVSRISVTNSAISAAGRPGLVGYFNDNTSASYIDNFSATDPASGQPAVKRMGGVQFAHRLATGIWQIATQLVAGIAGVRLEACGG